LSYSNYSATGASQLCDPHPKSLSLRERDFEIRLPFSLGEKGLGDEGTKFAKVGCTPPQLLRIAS